MRKFTRKLKLLVLLCIVVLTANAQQNKWTYLTSNTTVGLQSVFFVNETHGWTIGWSNTLMRTTDGGTTWTSASSGITQNFLYDVFFIDQNTGWLVGMNGAIFKSTDGGDSWAAQTSGTSSTLFAVWFNDADNGFAAGGGGTRLKTTNGGTTWTAQTNGWDNIFDMYFKDGVGHQVGYMKYYKSTDGGDTWTETYTFSSNDYIRGVQFIDENIGYAAGDNFMIDPDEGFVYKTVNGGTTWTKVVVDNVPVYDLFFTSSSVGYAVGGSTSGFGGGKIWKTTDGGANWAEMDYDPSAPSDKMESVYFPSASIGYAVGNDGKIMKLSITESSDSVTDIDGNDYPVVEIGAQKWMGSNLKTTKYNDNTPIDFPDTDNSAWSSNETGAYAWFNNDISNKEVWGALYNWHAVNTEKLCPTGWFVPSDDDWKILEVYLGIPESELDNTGARGTNEGGKLKMIGTDYWTSPNEGANNSTGFGAVGSGTRYSSNGAYAEKPSFGSFWTSTEASYYTNAVTRTLNYDNAQITRHNVSGKNNGKAVRCLKLAEAGKPTLTTTAISAITQTTATSGGIVTNDGGATVTARGVCWSTSENPTIAGSKTENGTGTGEFTSEITGLTANTTYYVRAYATNSQGTAYGQQVTFTTEAVDEVINLPFAEGFEDTTFPPTGWVKFMGENGLGNLKEWMRTISTSSEGSASAQSAYETVTEGMRSQDWLVTPKIQLEDANNYLSFYEKDEFATNYGSTFKVLISKTSQTSHATFTELVSYNESSLSHDTWSKREINLDNYAGEAVYIAFVHEQNFGDTWFIDDINVISEAPTVYFAGGQGTQADPWQVETPEHLNNVRNYLGNDHSDKYFVQIANINLDQAPWNTDEGWVPIGGEGIGYFTGNYDGANYSISGLYINRPNVNYQGLFGMVQNGVIKNVSLISANVKGEAYVGALLGWSSMATIEGCSAESIVVGEGEYAAAVGGLAGYNYKTTMSGCSSSSTVTGDYFVGGLVGNNNESVYSECFSSGTVTGMVEEAGGLIGRNYVNTNINECYSTANVTGKSMVGGFVGSNVSSSISNSYATGSVENSENGISFGGFVGNNQNTSTITNCYSIGLVNSTTFNSGGFSGTNSANISGSYWNTTTSGKTQSTGGTGLSTSQMLTQASFSGWDFTIIWDNIADVTYPFLRWQGGAEAHNYPEVSIPVVATMNVTNITQTTASSGGAITDHGGADITAKGVVWSTTANPTLESNDGVTNDGTGTTEFSSDLTGLTTATTYYVRAFATNSMGTGYGNEMEFTTEEEMEPATICEALDNCDFTFTTDGHAKWFAQTDVTNDGVDAVQSGNISHDEITWFETTVQGPAVISFWWKVSSESSYDQLTFLINEDLKDMISGEVDWDQMTYSLGDGEHNLMWAYLKDGSFSEGADCGWVDQFVLTPINIPTISTNDVTNVSQNSATSGGVLYGDGGAEISMKGVVWSISENPTLGSNEGSTMDGTGLGNFTSTLTGLTHTTTYYLRAYASNAAGTVYGSQKSFTTTATSIGIESISSITAYPNPFANQFNISSEKGIRRVVVLNISGQILIDSEMNGQTKVQIESENLNSGVYILKVTDIDGNQSHTKILKR